MLKTKHFPFFLFLSMLILYPFLSLCLSTLFHIAFLYISPYFDILDYLEERVSSPVKKTEITALGIRHADHTTHFIRQSSH
jgi:hypothetical protein